jgi:hypothetical protein
LTRALADSLLVVRNRSGKRATENTAPALPQAVGQEASRFTRNPSEFNTTTPSLTVVTDEPGPEEIC